MKMLFEATGMGVCVLTDTGRNMMDLFEVDSEVVTYSSTSEAIFKANYLLQNLLKAEEIAAVGREKTLTKHTTAHRCEQINEIIRSRLQDS